MPNIVFAPLNAWGHICACIPIAQTLKSKYNAHIIFIINQTWAGKLIPYGFQEEIYYNSGIPLEEANKKSNSPSQYWTELVTRLGPIMKLSSYEKIRTFGIQAQEQMCIEVQASNLEVGAILTRIKPDLIITDNYVLTPALITYNVPWIRLRSASPLEINPTENIPPGNSGYSVNDLDKHMWNEFRKEQADSYKKLWIQFSNWFRQATNDQCALPPGEFIIDSPFLNLYVYPKELDYIDKRPMPKNWVRIDALIPQQQQQLQQQQSVLSVIPNEFLSRNNNQPVIYVSIGTFGSADLNLINKIIQILHTTQLYCIIVKGPFHEQLEFPSSSKFWGMQTLPQTQILPLIDIVICHGGNSTVNECFYFGKPMIVLPIFGDEYDNAQRVHELGYGIRLDPYGMNEGELINAIRTLNEDLRYKNNMLDASKRIQAANSVEIAADLIFKHVEAGGIKVFGPMESQFQSESQQQLAEKPDQIPGSAETQSVSSTTNSTPVGRIEWTQFVTEAKELEIKSDREWKIEIADEKLPGGIYLTSTTIKSINNEFYRFEYHIIYSIAYSVPVLYFNISNLNGQLVPIEKYFSIASNSTKNFDMLKNAISQGEHPILLRPYYFIHPCRTENIMNTMKCNNFVISWLSIVARILEIPLSLNLFTT